MDKDKLFQEARDTFYKLIETTDDIEQLLRACQGMSIHTESPPEVNTDTEKLEHFHNVATEWWVAMGCNTELTVDELFNLLICVSIKPSCIM